MGNLENLEKDVEAYLCRKVERLGGICLKYSNPGMIGYPDRVVLLPDGVTLWVELKKEGGRLSAIQKVRRAQLMHLGHKMHVCYGKDGVDDLLYEYQKKD